MISILNPSGVTRPLDPGVYQISRQKVHGPLTHYGVLVTGFPGSVDEVVDMTPQGVRYLSIDEFAEGLDVTILDGKPPQEAHEVILRAREALRMRPGYDVLGFNCEHLARLIYAGESKSSQVSGLATVATLVVVGLLLSSE